MTNVFEAKTTVEQWDSDYYHPLALQLYDLAIVKMLRLMNVEKGATVLDAGCGPGVHSIRVAKAGYNVCAIDLSHEMLRQAKERVEKNNLTDKVEFHQKDLTKLDLPDASFKYVFSWGVIIHIPEANKALDELARVVQPGGKLALYITNKTSLDVKIESFVRFIVQKPPKEQLQHLPLGDGTWYFLGKEKLWVWRYDAKAVANYLSNKGFRLIHHRLGELSDIQRRVRGPFRNLLLKLNNLAYRLNVPVRLAHGQLMVFEKAQAGASR